MKRISVLLVEDHAVVRQGLRALLEAQADIAVAGEAENGRVAVQLAKSLRPDVVVMDIAMPLLNGLEATRQILKAAPGTKVLILSAHSDDEYIEQVIKMGAAGYLNKLTSADILCQAVREVFHGEKFYCPMIASRLRSKQNEWMAAEDEGKKNANQLSSREAEVLQLIAEGKANKQIAAELGISIKTVEKHRQNVMTKLNIHDTAGLTRYALKKRIIEQV